ncbi:MAG: hypothetical protein BHW62_03725 [Acinetobacter sp. CAG:196_36_41]|mgnify:CR=1 FL=1|nr:MAG: hypothetical protein BHW62_03725 [Acinetobacter sp. CAG:196_36_41]
MAFNIDESGNITMIQGDSGSLVINGLKTDKNYTVYFAIQDINRKPVGNELHVNTNKASSIVFELTGDFTDLLTVSPNASCAVYYYGVKLCSDNNFEDTLLIGNGDIGSINTITVFPKKVEGA